MRILAVILASATLGAYGETASNGSNEAGSANELSLPGSSFGDASASNAAAPEGGEPARNAAGAAPSTGKAIPEAFVGTYDENIEACTRPSQYRLQLSSGQLRFHESIGTVVDVRLISPSSVSVTADYEGEGEKWQSVRQLDLTDDGTHLVVSGDGTSFTRVRCP